MFIDFAGMMINTKYIISIYKTNYKRNDLTIYEVNIQIETKDHPSKEGYATVEERDKRFNEIIDTVNNEKK